MLPWALIERSSGGGDFGGFTGFFGPEAVGSLSMQILWATFSLSRDMLEARDAKALYPGSAFSSPLP